MTPSQLKEHNTMLLLLKQKEAEEQEMEENKKQEREDKISELLNKEDKTPELEHEIEELNLWPKYNNMREIVLWLSKLMLWAIIGFLTWKMHK